MLRGLLGGAAVGAIVAGLGLAAASLFVSVPISNEAPQVEDTTTLAPEVAMPAEPTLEVEPVTGIQIEAPVLAPPPTETEAEVEETPDMTLSADKPQVDASLGMELDTPTVNSDPAVSATDEDPVLPSPLAAAPQTPPNESDLSVSTESAVPVIVEVPEDDMPAAEAETGAGAVPSTDDTPLPEVAVDRPAVEAPEAAPETNTDIATPSPEPTPTVPRERPSSIQIGGNAMPGNADGVVIRRLVDDTKTETTATEAAPSAMSEALVAYSIPFTDPLEMPKLSIILIDEGALPDGPTLVRSIPFDVTVAIPMSDENAAQKMRDYRSAGIEVVAIADLPAGASAGDAAISMEATFNELPETVALLDIGIDGAQPSRQATEAVLSRLDADGRGYISGVDGLGSGLRLADTFDVPAVEIARDLDSNGQDATVIRRFLDFAAFQTRQQDGAVLLARIRAETISALTLWATANRASQVALAPVSAILLEQD